MDRFKALLITRDEAARKQSVAFTELTPEQLMPGNVDVRVEYSTVNYKDGLAITGKLPVVRRFPMIPGVDLAGTIIGSRDPAWKSGDRVLLNGWGVGEIHYGAYSQMARLNGDWLIPLPAGLTAAETMALGTAGYTAMLSVLALERHGLKPGDGPLLVTGASGGLGSIATMLLARLGFTVHAATGKAHEHDYLRQLGASEIVDRAELQVPPKALARERWAGGIDAVGGVMLANALSMARERGIIAACGNVAGMELATSIAPFILRGVTLAGIESVRAPKAERIAAWQRLARDVDRALLAEATTTMPLAGVVNAAHDIVEGKVRGRLVVEIG
ncbi:MAG TPA: MDR family oxidoreductase [Bauldia sp.]|nr:MDR family oxidoreductase [Bauldia sp.]